MSRWNHWRSGARDHTPTWVICLIGFGFGVTSMGIGELLLVLSS